MNRPHVIERIVVDVELVGSEREGAELDRRLVELCRGRLVRALEAVLDRHAPGDVDLVLPSLTLDVGTIELDGFEDALTASLGRALGEELGRRLAGGLDAARDERGLGSAQSAIEALVHFVRSGRLPWWWTTAASSLEETVFAALGDDPAALIGRRDELVARLSSSHRSRRRLAIQLPEALRRRLVETLAPASLAALDAALIAWRGRTTPAERADAFEEMLWPAAIAVAAGRATVMPSELAAVALRLLSHDEVASAAIRAAVASMWPAAAPDDSAGTSRGADDAGPSRAVDEDRSQREIDAEMRDGLYVADAGLVLLHPFLARFFERLAIVDGERMIEPDRAVALLHFLVSGSETTPEHDVALAKTLCGVPVDEPVRYDVAFTEAERTEAVALLEAVIGHWSALRSTSPDGLRGSFLMRPGKVVLDEHDEWRIQVETRTYDILLDQLPWGIAMFRLPWLDRICRVEWTS